MPRDPELLAHQEWLGYLQPVGLVVSPPALVAAQAYINQNIIAQHNCFLKSLREYRFVGRDDPVLIIGSFPEFVQTVLAWESRDLVGGPKAEALPTDLEVVLPEYGETLRPTYAVKEFDSNGSESRPWLMLIQELPVGREMDRIAGGDDSRWQATPHARFERLLREKQVPIGLISNSTHLRLIYAPRGETSGYLTFPVQAMSEVAGRPIFAALHMLLCAERLFSLPRRQRLPAILGESRKYQTVVSTQLSQQVLHALYELLRGFQAADDHSGRALLADVLREEPNQVYAGLLTTLMRLVFTLYAEDRGLFPADSVYTNWYSITGLFERLRSDESRYPDSMNQRYGAWAQLLTLFRLIYDGASHGSFHFPSRHGHLFDPDRYPFLEGRPYRVARVLGARLTPPLVSDSVVFRVLQNLLLIDGERISYRTLDVEQIGSVYETMMGFKLEVAKGRSIAVKPEKAHGAPVMINLDELLEVPSAKRLAWVREKSDHTISGQGAEALKAARTPEDLVAALGNKVSSTTAGVVPPAAMILQPSDERRRSGSHYTPRSLTEPIVSTTLQPILQRFGEQPKPEQILELKICDPAMGSGAFLVEVCRQLGDELVKAWHFHSCTPKIPPDEDEVLHARRMIAQRCVYGVDKNPLAVDLAKLSLWLATLAKDHPFTFLDHALRHGDSLVGLTKKQIAAFHWELDPQMDFLLASIEKCVRGSSELRFRIRNAGESIGDDELRRMLKEADDALLEVRLIGDLVVLAFFQEENDRERLVQRGELAQKVRSWLTTPQGYQSYNELRDLVEEMRGQEQPIAPFHWEIEFPEVFERENPGFDALVGNPPFLSGRRVSTVLGMAYFSYLSATYQPAGNLCDIVAYFFRKAFTLLREGGTFGLLATNTIAQGDTREGGLLQIRTAGGLIYNAVKRFKWPGQAAVVVSIVHVQRGGSSAGAALNGKPVEKITAHLFSQGPDSSPQRLAQMKERHSLGSKIYGQGFLFDDDDDDASPTADMTQVLQRHPEDAERIRPYVSGEDLNDDPRHRHSRYAIYLSDLKTEQELSSHPELAEIVLRKVKPVRDSLGSNPNNTPLKKRWWAYQAHRPDFYAQLQALPRLLAICRVTQSFGFCFLEPGPIFSEQVVLIALPSNTAFAVLQSRLHEIWARFFASTLGDALRYTPSDCFETFPFPPAFETNAALEATGREYYEFRATLMVRNSEGLTKTYNRFHNPDECSPEILDLRKLHAAMDRAVLDAYGWTDLKPTCEFLLDYDDEKDDEEGPDGRHRRKPWRYRWPDDFRDEVLARLLELNKKRAQEERLAGGTHSPQTSGDRKKRGKKNRQDDRNLNLFES